MGTRTKAPRRRGSSKALQAAKPATKRAASPTEDESLRATPTALGRQLLRLVALMRHAWCSVPDEDTNPEAFEAFEGRQHERLHMAAAVAAAIAARPVRTLSDVVDRAIAATYHDDNARFATLWAPVLAIGGVRPAACDKHP